MENANPLNPKLKDSTAFANACEDVSQLICFLSIVFFRHWHDHGSV